MEYLLSFLEHPTSNATLIIIVVVVFGLPQIPVIAQYLPFFKAFFKNAKDTEKISQIQDKKYPELSKDIEELKEMYRYCMEIILENKKFNENHSMHEIPEMRDSQKRTEALLEKMDAKMDNHQDRLTQIETIIKIKFDL